MHIKEAKVTGGEVSEDAEEESKEGEEEQSNSSVEESKPI